MAQVVEGDLRKPCALQERFEGSLSEVGGVDGIAAFSGEHEVLIPVETTDLKFLFGLACPVTLEGLQGARGQPYVPSLAGLGCRAHDVPASVLATRERPTNPDGGEVEVNVRPLERQQLASPYAGVDGEHVEGFELE